MKTPPNLSELLGMGSVAHPLSAGLRGFYKGFNLTNLIARPILVALLLGMVTPTSADQLDTYITLSCDAAHNRAMLRFGYSDGDHPPVYQPIAEALDWGLSRQPTTTPDPTDVGHDHPQEASCVLANGQEIKARYGFGPVWSAAGTSEPRQRFSVWVNRKKIISKAPLSPAACNSCLIHSVIIERNTFRRCDFDLATVQNIYDATSESVEVNCTRSTALAGVPDPIEYPPPGNPKPPPFGSMGILGSAHANLCRALVVDESKFNYDTGDGRDIPNDVPSGYQVVSLRNVGGAFKDFDSVQLSAGFKNGNVALAKMNFTNNGVKQNVYWVFAGNHYFSGDLFVVTDLNVPEAQVVAFLSNALDPAGDVDYIDANAKDLGWFAFSGEETPYKAARYTNFRYSRLRALLTCSLIRN